DALETYRYGRRPADRLAAAIVLMSLRNSDNPSEKLGDKSSGVNATSLWKFLKTQSETGTPEARLAAGDYMLRTSRSASNDMVGQQRILAALESKSKEQPNDADLKAKIEEAKARAGESKKFQELTRYAYYEYGRVCMD